MVYVHIAEGFEEVEALTIVDVLRRAECKVMTVSMTDEYIVTGTHEIAVKTDMLFGEADYDSCEMIVLPGGMPGASNLQEHKGLEAQIKAFASAGKKLAAICAAPMVLAAHGALQGKSATIYPGMEEFLKGATPTGEAVTKDGNVITGQGPALAMEFALKLVEDLKGAQVRDEVAKGLLCREY
ncbi:MAG: DJ-1/PfpI family protein [Bacillota bacterium]|nr:DJ-1/PfpI family protein [Bacillota bacterium]